MGWGVATGWGWGTLARAAVTIWQVRSSGRMVVRDPLNARPIGERAVATMTASVIGTPWLVVACRLAAYVRRPVPRLSVAPLTWAPSPGCRAWLAAPSRHPGP